ncbi:uncharacterized protein LODBEIA_P06970 [Lodderomyces beijingensis]|uniref:NUC153 domain-containing protein n=1 Tax=Lodderomyces beijingensis TaxID=1775926 RepID=A0ABP0ZE95_9ASCO
MVKDRPSKPVEKKGPVTQDLRFKSVHNDPRFKFPNFRNLKVKVDDRFSRKELKKLSENASGKQVKIDKYGRRLNEGASDLNKFYEYEDEQDEEQDEEQDDGEDDEEEEEESEEESDEESDEEEPEVESKGKDKVNKSKQKLDALEEQLRLEEAQLDKARGEGLSSSSEDDDSASSSDEEEPSVNFEESDSEIEIEESKPDESEPTSSFAVVNMDWDNLRAEDLMATFSSFVPKGGRINSVTIYPSEFGKERMQKEEIEGPSRELFKSKKKANKSDDDDDDDDESDLDSDVDITDARKLERVTRKLYNQDDGKEDYDSKALRRYQLQRLRYYYAVVDCDSVHTSQSIYSKVDGTEYESTANMFDLRYIPEDMTFDADEAKDKCVKVSAHYRPDSRFVTDALQHSKVKLTWDETPKERLTLSSRPLSQKEIEENDFKAYLASDSDEDDEGDKDQAKDSLKSKYQSLFGDTFQRFGKEHRGGNGDDDDDDDVDMEITFDPGLKDGKDADTGDEKTEESTIDAYKRKEKERRQRRLNKFKESKEAREKDEGEDADEDGLEDAKQERSKKPSKKKKGNTLDDKQKAELELVLMDSESQNDHFNMRDVLKQEKSNKKNKNQRKKFDDEMTQDKFEANLNDPRFKEIFENHDFAIDPTSSEFKQTETMKKILQERANRNKNSGLKNENSSGKSSNSSKKRKRADNDSDHVKSLAAKLKKRSKSTK